MNNLFYIRDEQTGHSNTIPSIVQERYIAHPSSPISQGNCQAGVFLICECIPSPPSEDTPLDITTMVESGEIASIVTYMMSSTILGFLLRFFPRYIFKSLSTISPSANDKQLLTENNMKITSKVLCLGVVV